MTAGAALRASLSAALGVTLTLSAGKVFAADKDQAAAQCEAVYLDAFRVEEASEDRQAELRASVERQCACVVDGVEGLGDDGLKMLRVMAKTTLAMTEVAMKSPQGPRGHAITMLVAEFGLSEADATAVYERTEGPIGTIYQECSALESAP